MSPEERDGPEAVPASSIDAIMASIRAGMTGSAGSGAGPPSATPPAPPSTAPSRAAPSSPVARLAAAPASSSSDGITLEALVRSMLAPMLKEWLDAHLPEIVEAATHAEIRRLTGRGD